MTMPWCQHLRAPLLELIFLATPIGLSSLASLGVTVVTAVIVGARAA